MKNDKVLIEKFQGYEIFYVKGDNIFVADDTKHDIHFEAGSLFQIECDIKSSKKTAVDRDAYLKTGFFGLEISEVKILTINKANKRFAYKILACTDSQYDVGRIKEDEDLEKFYDVDEHNTHIFNAVKNWQEEITKIEAQQAQLVKKLK